MKAPEEAPADQEPADSSGVAVKSPAAEAPVSMAPMTREPVESAACTTSVRAEAVRAEAPDAVAGLPAVPSSSSATGTEPVTIVWVVAFLGASASVGASFAGTFSTVLRSCSGPAASACADMVCVPLSSAHSPSSGVRTQSGRSTRPKRSAAWGP